MGRGRAQNTIDLLEASRDILEEIQPCSVRAVCYRLFSMGLLASMHKNETNKVSRLLTQAREDGDIPWEWVVDETRSVESGAPRWDDPVKFMDVVKQSYRKDHWALQPTHVEVWSEKGTIRGTLGPVLKEFGVPFRVMHGYTSATSIHDIVAQQVASWLPWAVFYVGDFDPSGLHMSEADLPERLHDHWLPMAFARSRKTHHDQDAPGIDLERIALSEDDILNPDLPSFPLESKRQDPRHAWYTETVGELARGRCWEVDALSPVVLRERVRAAILAELDQDQWQRSLLAETAEQSSLHTYFAGWKSISGQASKYSDGLPERSSATPRKDGGCNGSKREPLPNVPPTPKNVGMKGRKFTGSKPEPVTVTVHTLAKLGLTKDEIRQAQQLAQLSEDEYEQVKNGLGNEMIEHGYAKATEQAIRRITRAKART